MNQIERVFDMLDHWRHLPDYQLERRADIFFAVFMPKFLSQRFGVTLDSRMVPEFPVRIGTIYPEIEINKSFKIDYVAMASDRSKAFLVELKTDSSSRREKQDKYLKAAQSAGLRALLGGVIQIVRATQHKHKYVCLLRLLADLQLLQLPAELDEAVQSKHWASGINACLDDVEIAASDMPLEIVYVQPKAHKGDEVGFDEIATCLDGLNDPLAERFATSLRNWASVLPGRM